MDYLDRMSELEEWKYIDGYEEYLISNTGRVKSLKKYAKTNSRILKPSKDKRGYLRVSLWNGNKPHSYMIHRLVAQAFLKNPEKLPQVNHKDEDKQNNNVDNLEYCTNEYNVNYGSRKERISKKYGKPIVQLDLEGNIIKKWNGTCMASRQLNINEGNIWECCNKKRKTAKGYIWRYCEEEN